MTDWGSHGAGDASETQTPIVAWGAGIPAPVPSDSPACRERTLEWPEVDGRGWNLSGVCRQDTWQADISPLIATLIGVPIPVNSVGSLRRAYLRLGGEEMAQAAFTNARQMLSQHAHRRALVERHGCAGGGGGRPLACTALDWLPPLYRPFPPLPPHDEGTRLASIKGHIDAGDYGKAIAESDELFALASSGLEYHHRYHKTLLLAAVSFSFVGWILLLVLLVVEGGGRKHCRSANNGFGLNLLVDLPVALLSSFMALYLFVFASPLQYYVYCLLPFALWWSIVRVLTSDWYVRGKRNAIYEKHWDWRCILRLALLITAYLAGIEILVLSFFHRWVLSLGMLGLAFHPLTTLRRQKSWRGGDACRAFYWAASCFMVGAFPFMPVVGKDSDTTLVTVASLLFVALGMLLSLVHARGSHAPLLNWWPQWVQLLLLPLAAWNAWEADHSFSRNQGLPLTCQLLSWSLSVLSIGLPLVTQQTASSWPSDPLQEVGQRLVSVSLSLAVPYILLSVNHEGFFLLALAINVNAWVLIEINMAYQERRQGSWNNLRISYTFMFLIITSFFGTGNIASINSFDPAWVRRFLSVFSPHTMGALILAKTCIPFLLVSCAFRSINILLNVQTKQLFLIVLALSDACGLHFLHLVRDEGSWMEIGSSLSHFVIQETMVVFLLLLYALSCACMPQPPSKVHRAAPSASVSLSIDPLVGEPMVPPCWPKKNKSS